MTSQAGSVPQFKIDPYYIQKATTDEAISDLLVSLGLQKCTHCFTAYYCKKECQTGNWKLHKAEWLKHDEVVKEALVAHQPKFVAPAVTGGFTSELCQLIADYDHYIPKKS